MNQRYLMSTGAAALAITLMAVWPAPPLAAGQGTQVLKSGEKAVTVANNGTPAKPYVAPKTPDGVPDLQGYWTNNSITPLQRPQGVTKEFYTPEEFAAAAKKQADSDEGRITAQVGTVNDVHYDFTQFGLDKSQTVLNGNMRTSLITNPSNGKIPPVTEEGKKRAAAKVAAATPRSAQYDTVKNIVIGSRCIYQGAGPPMLPPGYNPGYQIVQGAGYVMILIEAGHEVRVIPTDNRPHAPEGVRSWLGDSRGHWEGNSLVVETSNFNGRVAFQGSSENLKVSERFTRTDANTIKYEFTINDPSTWETSWGGELPFTKMDGPIFEHACTEGNYGIMNTLAGARAEEKRAAAAAAAKKGGAQ
ncbi:MAG TPA: hypothetical protein VGK48_20530 [Terriglobia bacterium]|jgi:hypothetical protein